MINCHKETRLSHRGPEWVLKWIQQNAINDNTLHKDEPDKEYIDTYPPLCQACTK